jgi:hypothetical protein
MASTFGERIDALKELVGSGDLVGTVIVDQVRPRSMPATSTRVSTSSTRAAARRSTCPSRC